MPSCRSFNQAGNGYQAETIDLVEQRFEHRVTEKVAKLDQRISEDVAKLNDRMSRLDVKLSETKADLLRWMFIFWVGQVGALLGILFAFFRH